MKLLFTIFVVFVFMYSGFGQERIPRSAQDKSIHHSAKRETKLNAYKTSVQSLKESAFHHSPGIANKNAKQISKSAAAADVLVGYLYQTWNDPNWEDNLKYSAVLDGTDYIVEEVWETWNGSEWVKSDKETETHDVNGNWLEWTWYVWDGSWIEKQKQTQTYDINGNWTEWILYKWNNGWADSLRLTQTYDLKRELD